MCINYSINKCKLTNINLQYHLENNVIHIRPLLLNNVTAGLPLHDTIFSIHSMCHNLKIVKTFLYQRL